MTIARPAPCQGRATASRTAEGRGATCRGMLRQMGWGRTLANVYAVAADAIVDGGRLLLLCGTNQAFCLCFCFCLSRLPPFSLPSAWPPVLKPRPTCSIVAFVCDGSLARSLLSRPPRSIAGLAIASDRETRRCCHSGDESPSMTLSGSLDTGGRACSCEVPFPDTTVSCRFGNSFGSQNAPLLSFRWRESEYDSEW